MEWWKIVLIIILTPFALYFFIRIGTQAILDTFEDTIRNIITKSKKENEKKEN